MSNEAKRGVIRIAFNYLRLFCTLLIGIIIVPLTIDWLGDDAFGLIALLGANIGLAAIFRQIIQQSLVRELAAAYHGGDETMKRLYPAICWVALVAALLTLLAFLAVALALPFFQMPDSLRPAAFWFVIANGIEAAVVVFLAPIHNMYLVTERFVGYTVWYVGVRTANLISLIILGYVFTINDPARGLLLHGILWPSLAGLGFLLAAWYMVRRDPRLRPTLRKPEPGSVREVWGTFSWNSGVQVAMNLHEQIPPMLLNLFIGTAANAAWGLGFRLVAYIRMVTTGMQFGSDAVSARLALHKDEAQARQNLQRLTEIQTRLTGLISLPASAGVLIYCYPVLHLWVGGPIKDYTTIMGMGVIMARVLALALAARAISDTWVLILYGAGYIRRYAMLVITGGLLAPAIAVTLMLTLPEPWRFLGPVVGFCAAFIGLHLLCIPFVVASCLGISAAGLLRSVLRPLSATVAASAAGLAVLYIGGRLGDLALTVAPTRPLGDAIDPRWMLASMGVFGLVYAPLAYAFVLGPSERSRITGMIGSLAARRTRAADL